MGGILPRKNIISCIWSSDVYAKEMQILCIYIYICMQWLKGSFHNHNVKAWFHGMYHQVHPCFFLTHVSGTPTPRQREFAPRRTCPSWLWRVSAWPAPPALEMQPPALHVQVGGRLPGGRWSPTGWLSRETTGKRTNSSPKIKGTILSREYIFERTIDFQGTFVSFQGSIYLNRWTWQFSIFGWAKDDRCEL